MKRVILGSLLSCMLVGQVFGADNFNDNQPVLAVQANDVNNNGWRASLSNGLSAVSRGWNAISMPVGSFVRGVALGAGTTAVGTAVGSAASNVSMVAAAGVMADLVQSVQKKYPSMNTSTHVGMGWRERSAIEQEWKNAAAALEGGMNDSSIIRAAQSSHVQSGLVAGGTLAGVGYNLYQGISTLFEGLQENPTLTISKGMHATGRMIGSIAAACLAAKYNDLFVAIMKK